MGSDKATQIEATIEQNKESPTKDLIGEKKETTKKKFYSINDP